MGRMQALVIYLKNLPVLGACNHVLNVRDGRNGGRKPSVRNGSMPLKKSALQWL